MEGKIFGIPLILILLVGLIIVPTLYGLFLLSGQIQTLQTTVDAQSKAILEKLQEEVVVVDEIEVMHDVKVATPEALPTQRSVTTPITTPTPTQGATQAD